MYGNAFFITDLQILEALSMFWTESGVFMGVGGFHELVYAYENDV